MFQQDQRVAVPDAPWDAVPAGRAGDGSSGTGVGTVPPQWQLRGGGGVSVGRARGLVALAAFLLSGGTGRTRSSTQHWWGMFLVQMCQFEFKNNVFIDLFCCFETTTEKSAGARRVFCFLFSTGRFFLLFSSAKCLIPSYLCVKRFMTVWLQKDIFSDIWSFCGVKDSNLTQEPR